VVVSTGAGVALPFFIAARLRGIPTVYVEVYDRIDSRTLTGRLCRPLTSLFCVQWEEQLGLYRNAQLIGELL
jgi:UDP-N-acetylglucosamine:LPS N-acetylglucosamine transferase